MKIAFIVQRYGAEILGGSEYHCRLIAERLAPRHQVEVLTTCAADYVTWKNEYAEGADRIRGVTVRRFANARMRDIHAFNRYSEWIFTSAHTRDDEMEWLRQQGPWCPALLDTSSATSTSTTSSYSSPTCTRRLCLARASRRTRASLCQRRTTNRRSTSTSIRSSSAFPPASLTTPTSNGGSSRRISRFARSRKKLLVAASICQECTRRFATKGRADRIRRRRQNHPIRATRPATNRWPTKSPQASGRIWHSAVRRSAVGIVCTGRSLLYGGRIDPGKGCEELIEYFSSYVQEGGDATLALMGVKLMPLPEEPFIRFAGRLSDQERLQALEAATVVVVPSPYESLSLLALESFAVGTPILANARSEVLVDHCHRSNAGLYYADRDEFMECLKLLIADPHLRESMGRNGRRYVRQNYRWDVILAKYEKMFSKLRQAPGGRQFSNAGESRGGRR